MITLYNLVGGTTNVAGSGGVFAINGTLGTLRPFTVIPNGTLISYIRSDATSFEEGEATVATSGGVATLTRTTLLDSSTGGAISWPPGGTQNVLIGPTAKSSLVARNNFADVPDVAAACDNLLAVKRLATGLSGGGNSKVLRPNGTGAVTEAANTDSLAALFPLYWRGPDGLLYNGRQEVPGTFAAGSNYWLGTSGNVLTAPPTITTSVASLYLGFAPTTAKLWFSPSAPVRKA